MRNLKRLKASLLSLENDDNFQWHFSVWFSIEKPHRLTVHFVARTFLRSGSHISNVLGNDRSKIEVSVETKQVLFVFSQKLIHIFSEREKTDEGNWW